MAFGYYGFMPPYLCSNCPMMQEYFKQVPRTEGEQQDGSKEEKAMIEYDPNQYRVFPWLLLPLLAAPFIGGGGPAYYGPPPYYYNYYYYYNR